MRVRGCILMSRLFASCYVAFAAFLDLAQARPPTSSPPLLAADGPEPINLPEVPLSAAPTADVASSSSPSDASFQSDSTRMRHPRRRQPRQRHGAERPTHVAIPREPRPRGPSFPPFSGRSTPPPMHNTKVREGGEAALSLSPASSACTAAPPRLPRQMASSPATTPRGAGGRAVGLIDMDCFYCAVERALDPSLVDVPMAVVQYNPFQGDGKPGESGVVTLPPQPSSARIAVKDGKVLLPSAANGSIIAVSYEARARGVTRFFRGREAVSTCPELILIQVPTSHGKSDMGIYRDYGAKALKLIQETCGAGVVMEKASVDEMYVDLTKPARSALAAAGSYEELLREAAAAGTHVAGAAEGEEEAAMGAQPTGVLARSSFRAGHAGQVVRAIGAASAAWWARTAPEWDEEEMLLAAAAAIVARARAAVTRELGFTCSAGIAANKLLAKLCGGLHKPNQQTILPASAVQALLDPLPIDRLRGFGGKMGSILREGRPELGLSGFSSAGELRRGGVSAAAKLLRGEWAHPDEAAALAVRMASGLDDDAVRERPLAKQVGASKNFSGTRGAARGPLDTRAAIERWLNELAEDIATRLEQQVSLTP